MEDGSNHTTLNDIPTLMNVDGKRYSLQGCILFVDASVENDTYYHYVAAIRCVKSWEIYDNQKNKSYTKSGKKEINLHCLFYVCLDLSSNAQDSISITDIDVQNANDVNLSSFSFDNLSINGDEYWHHTFNNTEEEEAVVTEPDISHLTDFEPRLQVPNTDEIHNDREDRNNLEFQINSEVPNADEAQNDLGDHNYLEILPSEAKPIKKRRSHKDVTVQPQIRQTRQQTAKQKLK